MKILQKLMGSRCGKGAASLMEAVCYLVIAFFILTLILSAVGRTEFLLETSDGNVRGPVILADKDHDKASTRYLYLTMRETVRIATDSEDNIDTITKIALTLIHAVNVVPMIFGFLFLGGVFRNVRKGNIFVEKNARWLLYYGLLQLGAIFLFPLLKPCICYLANLVTESSINISTMRDMVYNIFQNITAVFFPSATCIAAAYIIHYGIGLQDEVDHTL